MLGLIITTISLLITVVGLYYNSILIVTSAVVLLSTYEVFRYYNTLKENKINVKIVGVGNKTFFEVYSVSNEPIELVVVTSTGNRYEFSSYCYKKKKCVFNVDEPVDNISSIMLNNRVYSIRETKNMFGKPTYRVVRVY